MIQTVAAIAKDHLVLAKFVLGAIVLWTSGALIGTSFIHYRLGLNHPVLLAQHVMTSDDHSVLAVHDEKLTRMAEQNQASTDDRKELHASVAVLADRLNVDEAQFKTTGAVFGVLFSVFSGVSTLITILEYRNKSKDSGRKRNRPFYENEP